MHKQGKHKEKTKKHKREKRHKEKKKHQGRKSSSSSTEEWVEKKSYSSSDEEEVSEVKSHEPHSHDKEDEVTSSTNRDEWMSLPSSFLTESHLDRRKHKEENKRMEREREQYNPRQHTKELNPYWKDGGDGLPKFKKPSEDGSYKYESVNRFHKSSNWKKQVVETSTQQSETFTSEETTVEETSEILSDKELNVLAAKLVKAEIMGKTELIKELKEKLENARKLREKAPHVTQREEVILTETDARGHSRPIRPHSDYGEFSGNPKKKKKVETHQDGQRVRYFPDDDKHSLQQMFENEKFHSVNDQNSEFVKMASKIRKNDDADEIFADNIRKKESDDKIDARNKNRAINEHHKISQSLDNCKFCLQSDIMPKHLMVTLGETVFLRLPSHEPLTEGHCLIVPIRHVSCSTLLDENEWTDIMDFRKALTKMFHSKNEDVIFFETAKHLEKYPHMYIECIPVDREEGDMAPIYFKKAIDECEMEWAQNKKLVSLKGKDVRRAIPKGLSYFFVSFGMEEGYAHVIEDQKNFPNNFAQEIIGGMLDLHHSKWRKPKQQTFEEQSKRVLEFSQQWNPFECTKT